MILLKENLTEFYSLYYLIIHSKRNNWLDIHTF